MHNIGLHALGLIPFMMLIGFSMSIGASAATDWDPPYLKLAGWLLSALQLLAYMLVVWVGV